jgi:hypothetical protein
MYQTFKDLSVGDTFTCNGNRCLKVSTRTAQLLDFGRVFYFGMSELVRKV